MNDLFIIFLMLAVFAFGYYIVARVDRFIEENQRMIGDMQSRISIAADSPMLLGSVAGALERCSDADPHISFFLSSGRTEHILQSLIEEKIDIVLIDDEHFEELDKQYASITIPYKKADLPVNVIGLPVRNLYDDLRIHVVWKKGMKSKDRDRVIFVLENEYCKIK